MIKKINTVSFYTLGCRLNQSETAVIQRTFEVDGYRVVDFNEPADMVVINTCTVTEGGDADTRRLVNKVNRINPQAKIALVGCQAQTQKEKLTDLPGVRYVVGNAKKMDLAAIVRETLQQDSPQVITPSIERKSFTMPLAGIDEKHTRANIKIQDGCDFFCSFCEIPYARGRARSRQFDDILKEARILTEAGHQEIVITGINVGTYQEEGKTLLDVIDALEQLQDLKRIRISSIEPTTIPLTLLDKMADKNSKLCRYLHIPLQSGSDAVLSMMKRKYTADEFYQFIVRAYETVKDICIGTDVIVGFPGETEADFETTFERLQEWPVHYFHVFSYSNRTMNKSRHHGEQVPPAVIQERSKILRDLSYRKRRLYFQGLLDSRQDVLFEQKKNGLWNGLTDHYARVYVESNEDLSNQMRRVQLNHLNSLEILGNLHG
ncbi:MAG: tRNA (N(6)-L-threonylcarbamoyladenosine(37)-C(2))-methylthiotransferase MtaB [Candidatus Omnitrophica bacterium]|nr:tRNA (N(6)-L-threonylcarbamoyladenosine(37)-C(2))-methylthiotransferase MtaB [Candidatus Omnitrophota bacterium]